MLCLVYVMLCVMFVTYVAHQLMACSPQEAQLTTGSKPRGMPFPGEAEAAVCFFPDFTET